MVLRCARKQWGQVRCLLATLMSLKDESPQAYFLMERYMPDILGRIFCVRALMMQLLDHHPNCRTHLVSFNRGHDPRVFDRLHALAEEGTCRAAVQTRQTLESPFAKDVAQEAIPQSKLARNKADNFLTSPSSNMPIALGLRMLREGRLLGPRGLL